MRWQIQNFYNIIFIFSCRFTKNRFQGVGLQVYQKTYHISGI